MKILPAIITSLLVVSVHAKPENNVQYKYGTVMVSTPIYRVYQMTGEERKCHTEEVVTKRSSSNDNAGTIVGGILGATVAHALGRRSKHKNGITVAGAILGSTIASSKPKQVTESRHLENRCTMVPTSWEEERIIGYDVKYRYNGQTFETRLPFEPSESLKLRITISPIDE